MRCLSRIVRFFTRTLCRIHSTGTAEADAFGKFKDESFALANDRGCLSMANAGPNGNGSQFFVCLRRASSWDNKHVVFGRVVSGLRLFDRIGNEVNVDTSAHHKPLHGFTVVVEDCGAMPASYVPPPMNEPLLAGEPIGKSFASPPHRNVSLM